MQIVEQASLLEVYKINNQKIYIPGTNTV